MRQLTADKATTVALGNMKEKLRQISLNHYQLESNATAMSGQRLRKGLAEKV